MVSDKACAAPTYRATNRARRAVVLSRHTQGIALTAFGVLVLSPDTLLIRLLGADLATTLFWRGLAMGVGLFAYLLIRAGGRPAPLVRQLRRPAAWALGAMFAFTNILFVTAVSEAAIADTLGCLATASIFAAVFSAVFLGEHAPLRVWITSAIIAVGLFMIALGGTGSGLGRVMGIGAAAAMGAIFVLMRRNDAGDTTLGLALGGTLIALATAIPAEFLALADGGFMAVVGFVVILPLAFGLIGQGPRYLPAPEVSLLMLLETVFGTLWAWLWLAEVPTTTTLLAIGLILTTLALFFARQTQVARRTTRTR